MNKKDLQSCFSKITPDNTQKNQMLYKVLDARAGQEAPKKHRARRFSATAVVAMVMVVVMATGVLAASLGWHEKMIENFNPTEDQVKLLSEATDTPEATITENGLTINILQTLTDKYNIYVLYEIIAPENIEFNDDVVMGSFFNVDFEELESGEVTSVTGGGEEIILENNGNKRTAIKYMHYSSTIKSGKIRASFYDMYEYNPNKINDETGEIVDRFLLNGTWEFEWDFDYVDTSRTLVLDEPITVDELGHNATSITISPFALTLFVNPVDISEVHTTNINSFISDITINFKDGTTQKMKSFDSEDTRGSNTLTYYSGYVRTERNQLDEDYTQNEEVASSEIESVADEATNATSSEAESVASSSVEESFAEEDWGSIEDWEINIWCRFNELINTEDVESITIGDVTIPME